MWKKSNIIHKHWDIVSYLFFGGCATIINWGSYYVLFNIFRVHNVISTVIAWVLAVVFAFITNKIWVFNSKSLDRKILVHEIWKFLTARVLTGLIDVAIMCVMVDLIGMNTPFWSTFWKVISNAVIVVLNYIFSKLFIFREKDKTVEK